MLVGIDSRDKLATEEEKWLPLSLGFRSWNVGFGVHPEVKQVPPLVPTLVKLSRCN